MPDRSGRLLQAFLSDRWSVDVRGLQSQSFSIRRWARVFALLGVGALAGCTLTTVNFYGDVRVDGRLEYGQEMPRGSRLQCP